tara:strand:+ start:183 stop:392 length:210 start_codon:yes stop_codon:yes gene_type:complete
MAGIFSLLGGLMKLLPLVFSFMAGSKIARGAQAKDEIKKSKTRDKIERNMARTPMSDLRKRLLSAWRRG